MASTSAGVSDRTSSGSSCPTCEHVYERHEGPKTGRSFLFTIAEAAHVLSRVVELPLEPAVDPRYGQPVGPVEERRGLTVLSLVDLDDKPAALPDAVEGQHGARSQAGISTRPVVALLNFAGTQDLDEELGDAALIGSSHG